MSVREAKKKQKLYSILEVAESLIAQNGLANLNMDQVAAATGLAKGTLYLYFKSKEELIAALALDARKRLLIIFEEHTLGLRNPLKKIEALIDANLYFLTNHPVQYQLVSFYETVERHSENAEMKTMTEQTVELVTTIMQEGQQQGLIRKDIDAQMLAFAMWGTTVGTFQLIQVKLLPANNHLMVNALLKNYTKLLLSGLKND